MKMNSCLFLERLADALQKQPELERQKQEKLQQKIKEGLAAAEKLQASKKLMDGQIFDRIHETREQVRSSVAEGIFRSVVLLVFLY